MTTKNVLEATNYGALSKESFGQKNNFSSWWNQQKKEFEDERFARMSIFLISQSCLGSIACAYILQNNFGNVALTVCIIGTMMCNALLIAQSSPKWCLRLFYGSILMNSLFIIVVFFNGKIYFRYYRYSITCGFFLYPSA